MRTFHCAKCFYKKEFDNWERVVLAICPHCNVALVEIEELKNEVMGNGCEE